MSWMHPYSLSVQSELQALKREEGNRTHKRSTREGEEKNQARERSTNEFGYGQGMGKRGTQVNARAARGKGGLWCARKRGKG